MHDKIEKLTHTLQELHHIEDESKEFLEAAEFLAGGGVNDRRRQSDRALKAA